MSQLLTELTAIAITTTGSAGSASGSGSSAETPNGFLYGFYADFHASAPATTKLVIKDNSGRTLWTGSSTNGGIGNTDGMIFPRAGTALDKLLPFAGRKLTFEVSLSDALTGAVTISPIIIQ